MSFLQMPIVCRTRATMRFGNIHFGDAGVMLHHFQGAMSQQGFECEEIAATSQVRDRKGMPKQMRVAFLDVDFPTQVGQQFTQRGFVQSVPCSLDEERRTRIAAIFSLHQIPPQRTARGFTQVDDASLRATFSAVLDLHPTCALFDIADSE